MEDRLISTIGVKKNSIQRGLLAWADAHLRNYPWRNGGRSVYEILIAELLLKRTTATAVARIYEGFLNTFPSIHHLANATEEKLAIAISGIGLQRQRAKEIKKMATHLLREEDKEIPKELRRLQEIPGVGTYTARAVLCFGYNTPVAVLDANVKRILSRLFSDVLPPKPNQNLLLDIAEKLLPEIEFKKFNWGLLDIGSLVCRYIRPLCQKCPINNVCHYLSADKWKRESLQYSKLREIRKEKKIGLSTLAKKAKVSKLTLIKIEAGKTSPRPVTLNKLAKALEINKEKLKEGRE